MGSPMRVGMMLLGSGCWVLLHGQGHSIGKQGELVAKLEVLKFNRMRERAGERDKARLNAAAAS
eukprot:10388456-Karenia_brevis.AAC.1